MTSVYDIGMYDGADTGYYLDCGYRVVAVEANPQLVDDAIRRFAAQIASGQLTCVDAAISPNGEPVELHLSSDLASSYSLQRKVAPKRPIGTITVPGVTLLELFERHGVPDYLKVDIEGADRLCVLALTPDLRPTFLSFEVGDDVDELLSHIEEIGFERFKIISQTSFRELADQRCYLNERVAHRLARYLGRLGYRRPLTVRRAGRRFEIWHTSGPVPWESEGRWRSGDATRSRLRDARASNTLLGWYDIHATLG